MLSRPDKRGRRWSVDEFLATGAIEIDSQFSALTAQGLPTHRRRALDFGCGAGRLTRALARHFDEVVGIDVAASMIAKARELNADVDNVEFLENDSVRFGQIDDASIDLCTMTAKH